MKIKIKAVENGFIVKQDLYHENEITVYENLADVLHHLVDVLGDTNDNSRHSENRIYIVEAPGDKHENFTEEHSNVIWGD